MFRARISGRAADYAPERKEEERRDRNPRVSGLDDRRVLQRNAGERFLSPVCSNGER